MSKQITVYHGARVEKRPTWFCEAAWAGDFSAGDFDQAEVVTGSGGRVRDGGITFVSASSTVDRLLCLQLGEDLLVSNSLPCILHVADSTLEPSYPRYNRDISSIQFGLQAHKRTLTTSAGELQFVYHDNLLWDGRSQQRREKPNASPEFVDFASYTGFLEESLRQVAENALATDRTTGTYDLLATISTGYDSPTVAALAYRCGCRDTICFDRAQGGLDDHGDEIARILGYQVHTVSRSAWKQRRFPEIPAIAGGLLPSVIFAGAEDHLSGKVLLTGYHGDKIWGLDNDCLGPDLVRGDCSGLGLTEYRLWSGFLHGPVPFWGARKADQIAAISKSDELTGYVLPGTTYNRPICRRLVEEAGVARDLFGIEKKAADLLVWQEADFLTADSLADYLSWLRETRWNWYRRLRIPPCRSRSVDHWLNELNIGGTRFLQATGRYLDERLRAQAYLRKKLKPARLRGAHPKLINLRQFYLPWAVERAKKKYAALTPAVVFQREEVAQGEPNGRHAVR